MTPIQLAYLRTQWGTFKIIFRTVVSGYSEDGSSPLAVRLKTGFVHVSFTFSLTFAHVLLHAACAR